MSRWSEEQFVVFERVCKAGYYGMDELVGHYANAMHLGSDINALEWYLQDLEKYL